MNFKEGWRIWNFGVSPLGAVQLSSPLVNNSYTLPAVWDGNRVMAQCILGCPSPPGPECRCGIRFYSHTGGFFDKYVERTVAIRTNEILHHRPGYYGANVISYGRPVGPCYQDPKSGEHGSWRHYWRTGRYDVLALLGWPEYPMAALGARYGVPTFTFDSMQSTGEMLERVASSVRHA
ncbi:Uncharacterised protein [Mycobacteroides abscessus subsp. abscessus]|nr:Uncharacterised protein [Mycobacteroides abscessus subsp. abscessus]